VERISSAGAPWSSSRLTPVTTEIAGPVGEEAGGDEDFGGAAWEAEGGGWAGGCGGCC